MVATVLPHASGDLLKSARAQFRANPVYEETKAELLLRNINLESELPITLPLPDEVPLDADDKEVIKIAEHMSNTEDKRIARNQKGGILWEAG